MIEQRRLTFTALVDHQTVREGHGLANVTIIEAL
jgi:hypothetical protein